MRHVPNASLYNRHTASTQSTRRLSGTSVTLWMIANPSPYLPMDELSCTNPM